MKILGIDTSSRFFCIGLYDNGKEYGYQLEVGRKLSSVLEPSVQRVLDYAGVKIKTIDYFACGLGPGSFTGMRTGVAAVKGMSWALNKPVIGIPTLDTIACNARGNDAHVSVVLDARRDLFYCGFFRMRNGKLAKISRYMLLSKDEFLRKVKPESIVLGDGLSLLGADLSVRLPGVRVLGKDYWYPKPHNVMSIALQKIREKKISTASNIDPIYLYPKECQIRGVGYDTKKK